MIYAVKRKNETNERLMRRFKKQVQRRRKSGLIREVRNGHVFSRPKTKRRIREEAISRESYREKKRQRLLWS